MCWRIPDCPDAPSVPDRSADAAVHHGLGAVLLLLGWVVLGAIERHFDDLDRLN